ncbi:MAG: cupin domain-containing protein [Ignavibacteria bacterium]|nr:cupin domain-containing protein [Ignavibacteria bacterium]
MQKKSEYWINKLNLQKHPEGGWFREVYRSDEEIKQEHLPSRYSGKRCHATSIYYLISENDFSAFHRLKSDEIWHFYSGSPVKIHTIDEEGNYSSVTLGEDEFQFTIKRGLWFAAELSDKTSYSLAGCTVSPGFDFDDFEIGKQDELKSQFPHLQEVIIRLTR